MANLERRREILEKIRKAADPSKGIKFLGKELDLIDEIVGFCKNSHSSLSYGAQFLSQALNKPISEVKWLKILKTID